jgi:rhodanese-related sulfurtransferase
MINLLACGMLTVKGTPGSNLRRKTPCKESFHVSAESDSSGETKMHLVLTAVCIAVLCAFMAISIKRRRDRHRLELEQHSITPDVLHTILTSGGEMLLYDVRQPLDLLADPEIIPGAKRIPPKEVLDNPSLIPKDKDAVVYCTCPSDETSRRVLHRALAMHLSRIKFLKGGLAAWRAKGYPVEPYDNPFQLDVRN